MRSLLSLAVALALVAVGNAATYQRINGIVVECDDSGTPKTVISVPVNAERVPISASEALSTKAEVAKVMTPVTSYRTVCENGVCRTVAETSYVEVNSAPVQTASRNIVNPNFVATIQPGCSCGPNCICNTATVSADPIPIPAATVWASPTGGVTLSGANSTCTTCGQTGAMRTESGNPVAFPRAVQAVESFRENRPVLFPRLHKLLHPNG